MGKYNPEYKKAYYEKNKERASEYWKEFYAANRERLLEKQAAQYRAKLPAYLFYAAKARAKKFEIPFSIGKTDIVIPAQCPVFGTPFEVGHKDFAPSVDKIDPDKGYVPGNIAVISMRANRLKNNATLADLESLVTYLKSVIKCSS